MAIKCTFWGLSFVSDDISLLASKLNEIYNQAVVAEVKVSYIEFIYFKITRKHINYHRKLTMEMIWWLRYTRIKHAKNFFILT